jgi:radical SAM protein with 4Fe4S-binding SPASM domain
MMQTQTGVNQSVLDPNVRASAMMSDDLAELASRLGVKTLAEMRVFPKYFEIETTNFCQARCEMCTINDWERKSRLMGDDTFEKVAQELSKYSAWIEKVALFRDGEPLLDKKIHLRVKRIKEAGIKKVSFSTNAGLMTEEKARAVLTAGIDEIMFSIDGFTKEVYEKIRVGLNFEEVTDNVRRFIQIRNEMGAHTRICIRMVLQEGNEHEHQQWVDYWLSQVKSTDSVYAKGLHSWGNQLDGYENRQDVMNYRQPCISPFSTMVVHSDGEVGLCGVDYNAKLSMGNVKEQTLEQIWRSDKFEDVRKKHESGQRNDIKFCIGCKIWDLSNKFIATV